MKILDHHEVFIIDKLLPGQRKGSKLWYEFVVTDLVEQHGMSVCDVVPALLRGNHSSMLLHVDDCLMAADREWMIAVFLPELRKKYKLTVKILDGVGSSIEFLKKTYISLENGIEIVPAGRHVQILAKKFEEVNGKPARVAKTLVLQQLLAADDTPLLSAKYHEHFRSLVGLLMYISQGSWGKNTSSFVVFFNGLTTHAVCRIQKVISLSSCESEWYAACSAMSDTYQLRFCLEFILQTDVEMILRMNSSSARQMAYKQGSGCIKHMRGRLLWMQARIQLQEFSIASVSTTWNMSDLNTKGLSHNRHFALLHFLLFCDDSNWCSGSKTRIRCDVFAIFLLAVETMAVRA